MIRTIEQRQQIKDSLRKTREKRKSQVCKVYELKVDKSSLNLIQKEYLKKIFIEAKWFYNHVLNQEDVFDSKVTKDKEVKIKILDKFETRKLEILPACVKLSLHTKIKDAITTLSKLKKLNFKVGRLKFKVEINSIEFVQNKIMWFIIKNKIKIAGCKPYFKVRGLNQIPKDCELANLILIRKPSGYYFKATTFQTKQPKIIKNKEVGLDFGIKTSITTSDGEKFNIKVPETIKLKKLQKHFARKKDKKSKRRRKNLNKIKQEYEVINNQKHDQVNKLVSYLTSNYDQIYIQDEMVKSWHKGLFGRQVQNSSLGAIKTRLKTLESVSVISKSYPTTKLCYNCGLINPISLNQRTYKCQCGYEKDRDIHSACNILKIGKTNSVMGRNSTTSEKKTAESLVHTDDLSYTSLKI